MEWTPLPVGVDNFEEIITKGYYYVDKTLLIKDLIDLRGKVNLFTRPRRFGKTLNMSMVRYFFEKSDEDRSRLFAGTKIIDAGEKYLMELRFGINTNQKEKTQKEVADMLRYIAKLHITT